MKTYRHPDSGQVQQVDDKAEAQIKVLTAAGYVLWDAAAAAKAKEQAAADNEKALAAAQKEMADRYPEQKPYFVAEDKPPKPGTARTDAGSVVAQETSEPPPKPPAVPKKS